MNNYKGIASAFDLAEESISVYSDVLIDLKSNWDSCGEYQLSVGGKVRNIESYTVSLCGCVAFFDDESKQLTVLSLSRNDTGDAYIYDGEVIDAYSHGKWRCELRSMKKARKIAFIKRIPAGRRRKAAKERVEMEDTLSNRALLHAKFKNTRSLIQKSKGLTVVCVD